MTAIALNKNDNIMSTWFQGIKYALNPRNLIHELTDFRPREWILLAVMLGTQAISFAFGGDYGIIGWLGLFTGVCTILSLILVDRGRITNYVFGFIGCAIWLIIALHNKLIGDTLSQAFYVIMNIIGVYFWMRRMNANDDNASMEVKPQKLTGWKAVLTLIAGVIGYLVTVWFSMKAGGNLVWLDAFLFPMGVLGQILMSFGYREQWYCWVLVDIINVIAYFIRIFNGGGAAVSMFALQVVMLINAIYGTYLWFKTAHDDNDNK